MTAGSDLDAMALAIAEYARSNNAWPHDIRTIADAFDLLASAAEMAAGSEHTHDSHYGARPWPTPLDDFLPHRLRRLADPEPRVWRAGDPEPVDAQAVLDASGWVWRRGLGFTRWNREADTNSDWYDSAPPTWDEIVSEHGPLVEVILPKPVTQ